MAGEIERLRVWLLDWGWLAVILITFGGIGLDVLLVPGILPASMAGDLGRGGCVLGTFLLAGIAALKPRKDIVALVTPLYALIIFVLPNEFSQGLLMQLLFAGSIAIVAVRMQRRFSSVEQREESAYTDEEDEQDGDGELPD